jgi:hypothetical protein
MQCEWKGHTINDPRTNTLVVKKGSNILKLNGFLKHDHFAYKPTQFTLLIKRQHLGLQNNKRGKKSKQNNLCFTLF